MLSVLKCRGPFPLNEHPMQSLIDINFGGIQLALDIEATRNAYANRPASPVGGCDCAACRNASIDWPAPLGDGATDDLSMLGIDIMTPTEIIHFGRDNDKHRYQVVYHARGKINPGAAAADIRVNRWRVESPGMPTEQGFVDPPVIEVSVEFELPWRINEPEPE